MRERLQALTKDQYQRLILRSQYLVRNQRLLAADLRQEAICRALDGRRKCRQSWDIVAFLNWVMRSMIRDDYRAEAEGRTLVLYDDLDAASLNNDVPSFEQMTHDPIDARRTIAGIREALRSDPRLLALLDAVITGKRGEELQNQFGVDDKGLAALRKRMNRAIGRIGKGKTVS
ncbi:sigma factor [uncultured Sphingomonas sp.]|uniref:sigma factor n=1 Tax=uncultured Sphingomonas sp. TaxID=158754 RepID=UPI0025E2F058|nr:sigma factor [uncultured Sphingomonas sp.]